MSEVTLPNPLIVASVLGVIILVIFWLAHRERCKKEALRRGSLKWYKVYTILGGLRAVGDMEWRTDSGALTIYWFNLSTASWQADFSPPPSPKEKKLLKLFLVCEIDWDVMSYRRKN